MNSNSHINFIMYRFATGGVERMFINLAKNLMNYDLRLIVLHNDFDDIIKEIPSNVRIEAFEDYRLVVYLRMLKQRFKFLNPLISLLIFITQIVIVKFILKFKADHNVNFSDTVSTLFLTWILPGRMLSWIHLNPKVLYLANFKLLYNILFQKCKIIVCICYDQKTSFLKLFPRVNPVNVIVVYNTIDTSVIDAKLEDISLIPDEKYMLMVSRLDYRSKDFATIIEAYSLLKDINMVLPKLFIIGDGPDRISIESLINEKQLKMEILLLGNDANPYKWMKNADLFIFSSHSEGFGLVLLEAMYCEVPIIASNCEVGPAEILEEGKHGILIDVGDVKGFKIAIMRGLIDSPIKTLALLDAKKRAATFDVKNSKVKEIF